MSPLLTPKVPGMEPLTSAQDGSMKPPTLLVRVYGPSTGTLIERDEELRILHTLSTDYGLGPRIEGTFRNGRVEQFFPSHALTPKHLRDPNTSVLIARRMRELHSVDLDALGFEERNEPTVWQRIREWLPLAKKAVGALKGVEKGQEWLKKFGLDSLGDEVEQYMSWVDAREEKGKGRVFCRKYPLICAKTSF
jgi:choline kinase